jgi:hypothetical protein
MALSRRRVRHTKRFLKHLLAFAPSFLFVRINCPPLIFPYPHPHPHKHICTYIVLSNADVYKENFLPSPIQKIYGVDCDDRNRTPLNHIENDWLCRQFIVCESPLDATNNLSTCTRMDVRGWNVTGNINDVIDWGGKGQ